MQKARLDVFDEGGLVSLAEVKAEVVRQVFRDVTAKCINPTVSHFFILPMNLYSAAAE